MKKGLRPRSSNSSSASTGVRTLALMKKGLRQLYSRRRSCALLCSNACPDEEGIKTTTTCAFSTRVLRSNACPDEEGIKTSQIARSARLLVVRTLALMKKGLRLGMPRPLSKTDTTTPDVRMPMGCPKTAAERPFGRRQRVRNRRSTTQTASALGTCPGDPRAAARSMASISRPWRWRRTWRNGSKSKGRDFVFSIPRRVLASCAAPSRRRWRAVQRSPVRFRCMSK